MIKLISCILQFNLKIFHVINFYFYKKPKYFDVRGVKDIKTNDVEPATKKKMPSAHAQDIIFVKPTHSSA